MQGDVGPAGLRGEPGLQGNQVSPHISITSITDVFYSAPMIDSFLILLMSLRETEETQVYQENQDHQDPR